MLNARDAIGITLSDDIIAGGHKRERKYTHTHTLSQFFMALHRALKEFNKEAHLANLLRCVPLL